MNMNHLPEGYRYTRNPARYVKGMVALQIPGVGGWKSTAACILTFEIAPNARYSGRERSYIVSSRQADRFESAVKAALALIETRLDALETSTHQPKG